MSAWLVLLITDARPAVTFYLAIDVVTGQWTWDLDRLKAIRFSREVDAEAAHLMQVGNPPPPNDQVRTRLFSFPS